jgi:predicted phosphodiesterase
MRLAVLSDIHGNALALETVLNDLREQGGADRIWILGDLVSSLPRPIETMQIIRQLQADQPDNVEIIGGNVDRYIVTGERRKVTPHDADAWAKFPQFLQGREDDCNFTARLLSWEDAEFIQKTIGRELALDVPEYGWVIGYHGAPGGRDEVNLRPDTPEHEVLDALLDSAGRLAFGGHTHQPMDREMGLWRVVNVGSVGMPLDGDPRAGYALATFDSDSVTIDLRRVEYDSEAVCADLIAQQHPNVERYATILRTARM